MMSPYLVGFIVMFGWLIVSCFMVDSLLTGGAWDKLTKFISLNHRFLTSGSIVNPRYPLSLRIGSGNSSNMATKKGQTHSSTGCSRSVETSTQPTSSQNSGVLQPRLFFFTGGNPIQPHPIA